MELKHRYPELYASCEEARTRLRILKPQYVTVNNITYDTTMASVVSQYDITNFINYQSEHPDVIQECFDNLCNILDIANTMVITESSNMPKKELKAKNKQLNNAKSNYMKNIYTILRNTHTQMDIDYWVLFLKSQSPYSHFF